MSIINLQIEGLDEFRSDVSHASTTIRSEVNSAMVKSVNTIKNAAQINAPFKTGNLRRSIYTEIKDSGFTGIVAQDPNAASYGIYIEGGTGIYAGGSRWLGNIPGVGWRWINGMMARPFMAPAINDNIDAVKGFFSDAAQAIVNKLARK